MRLSEVAKAAVVEAAWRWMLDPDLMRIGDRWAVVGRIESGWVGLLVSKVDDKGVWWHDGPKYARLRRDVVAALDALVYT